MIRLMPRRWKEQEHWISWILGPAIFLGKGYRDWRMYTDVYAVGGANDKALWWLVKTELSNLAFVLAFIKIGFVVRLGRFYWQKLREPQFRRRELILDAPLIWLMLWAIPTSYSWVIATAVVLFMIGWEIHLSYGAENG